jgi:hypothetical protein
MSTRIDRIQGTLAGTDGSVRHVRLIATIAELRGQRGIEDEQIARIELESPEPDGDYSLSYHHGKPYNQRVAVKHGVLVAG